MADDRIRITCACGKRYKIPANKAGAKVRCPACKRVLVVDRPAEDVESEMDKLAAEAAEEDRVRISEIQAKSAIRDLQELSSDSVAPGVAAGASGVDILGAAADRGALAYLPTYGILIEIHTDDVRAIVPRRLTGDVTAPEVVEWVRHALLHESELLATLIAGHEWNEIEEEFEAWRTEQRTHLTVTQEERDEALRGVAFTATEEQMRELVALGAKPFTLQGIDENRAAKLITRLRAQHAES